MKVGGYTQDISKIIQTRPDLITYHQEHSSQLKTIDGEPVRTDITRNVEAVAGTEINNYIGRNIDIYI